MRLTIHSSRLPAEKPPHEGYWAPRSGADRIQNSSSPEGVNSKGSQAGWRQGQPQIVSLSGWQMAICSGGQSRRQAEVTIRSDPRRACVLERRWQVLTKSARRRFSISGRTSITHKSSHLPIDSYRSRSGGALRVHCQSVRLHSSLGYKPPAPAAWLTEASLGYGKVESKERFPLSHTPDYGDGPYPSPAALH